MYKSVKIAHNELDSSSYNSCGYQEQTEQQMHFHLEMEKV